MCIMMEVDAADDKNQKLSEKYEVQGFPTLKLFKGQKASDYTGERTADAIVNFMQKKAGKPKLIIIHIIIHHTHTHT